jgi:hypothetical protein
MNVGGGGGCVGGCWVGGILVGGTDVFVGRGGGLVGLTRVDVGRDVGGAEVKTLAVVGPGTLVREVAVGKNVEVGVGVRVAVGVGLGSVEVIVGIAVGVYVGAVDVGNGPMSESEVNAMAVLVLLELWNISNSWLGLPNANQSQRMAPRIRAAIPAVRRLSRYPVMSNSLDFLFVEMLWIRRSGWNARIGGTRPRCLGGARRAGRAWCVRERGTDGAGALCKC